MREALGAWHLDNFFNDFFNGDFPALCALQLCELCLQVRELSLRKLGLLLHYVLLLLEGHLCLQLQNLLLLRELALGCSQLRQLCLLLHDLLLLLQRQFCLLLHDLLLQRELCFVLEFTRLLRRRSVSASLRTNERLPGARRFRRFALRGAAEKEAVAKRQ